MKLIGRISKIVLPVLIITGWVFSGWPQIWQNPRIPPGIQEAHAVTFPTTSYLINTLSTTITSNWCWQISTSAGASSDVTTSVKEKTTIAYFQWKPQTSSSTVNQANPPTSPSGTGFVYDTALNSTIPTGTWTFNVRTKNSAANTASVGHVVVCAWKVTVASGTITGSAQIFPSSVCVEGTTNVTGNNSNALYASSVSVASVAAQSFSSGQYLYVEYWLRQTTSSGSSTFTTSFEANTSSDNIVTPGASSNLAPNTPSQGSPANSATGVSITPTFTMTATDPESNNLGYKVTIYSNSACTTVVQTNDQAVSSVGWTGTNTTCTASPTSCYTSGTQGSFLTQTALSASTQYWWKASAKDPDGSGTFTDSSTCNTFTTGVAQTLTFSLGASSLALGTLSTSAVTSGFHTITVGTNAANGVTVTYSGATLTSGANTIAALSAGGTSAVGTEQFGINAVANTTPSVGAACSGITPIAAAATGYATANNFKFVSGETVVSSTGSINDTICRISYIANISGVTEAGDYGATLTFVATATF